MHGTELTGTPDILLVTRHYAPEPNGSAPVLKDIAEALTLAGHPVDVFTVRPSYPHNYIWPEFANGQRDRTVEHGVRVTRLPTTPFKGCGLVARLVPEARFAADVLVRLITGKLKRRRHVLSLCPSILTVTASLMLKKGGGKHVAIVHDIPSGFAAGLNMHGKFSFLIRIMKMLEAFTFNRVDTVIVLSEGMQNYLRSIGVKSRIAIIPPHVDTDELFPGSLSDTQTPTLLYSGNIGRKQGIEQLLALAEELRNRDCPASIVIRGEGNQAQNLRKEIVRKDLQNVTLEPFADRAEMRNCLSSAPIHLVPQLPEGGDFAVPSKVFSIMAVGRPFIATATQGSPLWSLMEKSEAFVCVPPHDPSAFCDAVETLVADKDRCATLGRNGRTFVLEYASRQAVLASYLSLLGLAPTTRPEDVQLESLQSAKEAKVAA